MRHLPVGEGSHPTDILAVDILQHAALPPVHRAVVVLQADLAAVLHLHSAAVSNITAGAGRVRLQIPAVCPLQFSGHLGSGQLYFVGLN